MPAAVRTLPLDAQRQHLSHRAPAIATVLAGLVAMLGLVQSLPADEPVDKCDFTLYLQTTGDWSFAYDGSDLGFSDHTRILYEHRAGALHDDGPEHVDLDEHLAALEAGIERDVPAGFDGIIILDYEKYPATLYSPWHTKIRDPRIAAEHELESGLSDEEAERRAAEKYLPHVQRVYLESIRKVWELRPDAKVGMYGMISDDRNLEIDDRYRWINDQNMWLYEAVDVIARPIYTIWHETDERWSWYGPLFEDKVAESVRLAEAVEAKTKRRPLVLPYVHGRVTNTKSAYADEWLPASQMSEIFNWAHTGGADGFIFWQPCFDDRAPHPTESAYRAILDTNVRDALEMSQLGVFSDPDGHEHDDEEVVDPDSKAGRKAASRARRLTKKQRKVAKKTSKRAARVIRKQQKKQT